MFVKDNMDRFRQILHIFSLLLIFRSKLSGIFTFTCCKFNLNL